MLRCCAGLGCELLATVAGDGSCEVWQLSSSGGVAAVDKLVALEPPKGESSRVHARCKGSCMRAAWAAACAQMHAHVCVLMLARVLCSLLLHARKLSRCFRGFC